jgi:hypothetical protein
MFQHNNLTDHQSLKQQSFYSALAEYCYTLVLLHMRLRGVHRDQGRSRGGGGGCRSAAPSILPKLKFNEHRFCRYYDIEIFYVISASSEISR